MRPEIDAALARGGGALSRAALLRVTSRSTLDHEIRRGELVRIAPRVYVRPWSVEDLNVADVAAIRYAAPEALISHVSALRRFGLTAATLDGTVHVTIAAGRRVRGVPGTVFTKPIVVHRSSIAHQRDLCTGLPSVPVATAVVQSWPLMRGSDQRAPLIRAARTRQCTPAAVRRELERFGKICDKQSLCNTLDLLEAGCESELEIWGYRKVFTVPQLARGIWQYPIGPYRVDLAYPDAKLAVELDGRAYHASSAQWARDIARDLELAKLGWQTIRLSHRRLTTDVEGCRRDVLAVLAHRQGLTG
jgi:hypothetical protein